MRSPPLLGREVVVRMESARLDGCANLETMTRSPRLSPRLQVIVDALPLRPDSRALEIGCGPGAAARAVAARLRPGHVLGIDRSAAAIAQARTAAADEITAGGLEFRQVAAEDFVLKPGEEPYDLVFAIRVGVLDGRHPKAGKQVLERIARATTPGARLFIDGGDPLRELPIPTP
jgi:SAM-dependent methyltransferase